MLGQTETVVLHQGAGVQGRWAKSSIFRAGMSGRGQKTLEFKSEHNLGVAVSLGEWMNHLDLEIAEPFPGK